MIGTKMIYGPPTVELTFIPYDGIFSFSGFYALDDSNDAIAWTFVILKSGTITEVGFNLDSKVGSPPDYNIGVVTINLTTGAPTTTPYSDGAVETLVPASISPGWNWFTLGTPITATVGDRVALSIWPTGTAPSGTNHIRIENTGIHGFQSFELPSKWQFATSWSNFNTIGISALKLSDGEIFGYPLEAPYSELLSVGEQAGVRFQLPFSVKSTGFFIHQLDSFTITTTVISGILYDENDNVIRSVSWNTWGNVAMNFIRWEQITLQANTNYKFVVMPTDDDIYFPAYVMDDPSSKEVFLGGENWEWIYRPTTLSGFAEDHPDYLPWCALIVDEIIPSTTVISGGSGGNYGFIG